MFGNYQGELTPQRWRMLNILLYLYLDTYGSERIISDFCEAFRIRPWLINAELAAFRLPGSSTVQ